MRIGEVLSRKWSDIEVRTDGYARVRLQASETKARYLRYAFLTRETVLWLRTFTVWLGVKSDWVFPGENETKALQYGTALEQIKRLFNRNSMKDNGPEIYTPHSFRTFADAQMRKVGLDSKYVSAIIGHVNKLQSEAHYLDWTEIEKEWVAKCEQKLTWLADSILLNRLNEEKTKTANLESLLNMTLTPTQLENLKAFLAKEVRQ
jgi:integrase